MAHKQNPNLSWRLPFFLPHTPHTFCALALAYSFYLTFGSRLVFAFSALYCWYFFPCVLTLVILHTLFLITRQNIFLTCLQLETFQAAALFLCVSFTVMRVFSLSSSLASVQHRPWWRELYRCSYSVFISLWFLSNAQSLCLGNRFHGIFSFIRSHSVLTIKPQQKLFPVDGALFIYFSHRQTVHCLSVPFFVAYFLFLLQFFLLILCEFPLVSATFSLLFPFFVCQEYILAQYVPVSLSF